MLPPDSVSLKEAYSYFFGAQAAEQMLPPGVVLFRRGERLDRFFLILSGTVDLQLPTPEGTAVSLRQLGRGAFAGELAVLRREPVMAEAIARTEVQVLACGSELLSRAIEESPAVRSLLIANLTGAASDATEETLSFYRNAQVFDFFVYPDKKSGPVIASSHATRAFAQNLERLSSSHQPVLLSGEQGSGKFFFATKLHELWCRTIPAPPTGRRPPFVAVDCRKTEDRPALEFIQDIARYGLKVIELDLSNGVFRPSVDGMLILRRIEFLNLALQEQILRLVTLADKSFANHSPTIRVIATTQADLAALVREGRFLGPLYELLSRNQLAVPPLRDRSADVFPLASHFAQQAAGTREMEFHPSARKRLQRMKFRSDNVRGLRKTIDFAVAISNASEIHGDQLVDDGHGERQTMRLHLLQFGFFRWLIKPKTLSWVRGLSMLSLALLLAAIFISPSSLPARAANHVIWWVWEPVLFFLFFFTGRAWCSVCPISSAAHLLQKRISFRRPVPEIIRTHGVLAMTAFFVGIISAEHYFHMNFAPLASAVMLAALVGMALLCAVVFDKLVWCRHLCPLGLLGASFGTGSLLQLRSEPSLCSETCKDVSCLRGAGKGPERFEGCPVFHHPLHSSNAALCVHCFRCLKHCSHLSIRYFLDFPFHHIWKLGSVYRGLEPFYFFIYFYALAIFVLQTTPQVSSGLLALLAAPAVALVLALTCRLVLNRCFRAETEQDATYVTRIGLALMLAAWGPLMAYHLERVPIFTDVALRTTMGSWTSRYLPSLEIPLSGVLQTLLIVLASILSGITLLHIRSRLVRVQTTSSALKWGGVVSMLFVYTVSALGLVFR